MKGAFQKLDSKKSEKILTNLNASIAAGPFGFETTSIIARQYSFYPGYTYIEIADHMSNPPREIHAVQNDENGELTILDWTNKPIYDLNVSVPIELEDDNIRDYIRFFFANTRGRHGQMKVIENVDDISWQEEPPPAARKAVSKLIEPIRVLETSGNEPVQAKVCFLHKDSIFKARVSIDAQGRVEISDEDLTLEEIPVYDDVLGQ